MTSKDLNLFPSNIKKIIIIKNGIKKKNLKKGKTLKDKIEDVLRGCN